MAERLFCTHREAWGHHTKMGQLWVVLPQASGTGRQKNLGSSVVFWPCHMVSPTAHLLLSTWHLCFDPAVAHLPDGQRACKLPAGWLLFSSRGLLASFTPLIFAFSSAAPSPITVVCYQSDRDELRRRVIQWLEAEIIPDGWFSKGSNYSEVLDKYFKSFDNGDSRLDSTEFLKFVEQNETAVNITTYMDQETNKLLRGLCVDALIELSDENADWKLSFNEFLKCLSPSFNPPEKKCALEDESYEDGAETQVECNRCVCACGNWVCTAMTCEGKKEKVTAQRQRPDEDLTEEELARYIQELQKHQETAEKTKRMNTKEM
uniref:Follistatin like 1 n=1 Tax=Strigops habroptila TaxID=2489341 RepID=A0A672U704_STRHB